MSDAFRKILHDVVLRLLQPAVAIFLRNGLSYAEFSSLARQVFVEAGFRQVGRSGKRPTVTAVAALTGLSRKEVKRLHEGDSAELVEAGERRGRAVRVLSGWFNDPEFLDGEGRAAVLPLDGETASFANLVRRFSGDMTPNAMLSLLQDSGNIAVSDGRATLLRKAFIPMDTPVDRLNILGTDVAELILTIGHNMAALPDERVFQRKVSSARIRPSDIPPFRKMTEQRSMALLEEYDAWLARHELDPNDGNSNDSNRHDNEPGAYVAVGIYYFDQSLQETDV